MGADSGVAIEKPDRAVCEACSYIIDVFRVLATHYIFVRLTITTKRQTKDRVLLRFSSNQGTRHPWRVPWLLGGVRPSPNTRYKVFVPPPEINHS